MYIRLTHKEPHLNEPTRWCIAIGETPEHWLVLLANKPGLSVTIPYVGSTVHAVLKSDYLTAVPDDKRTTADPVEDASDLL